MIYIALFSSVLQSASHLRAGTLCQRKLMNFACASHTAPGPPDWTSSANAGADIYLTSRIMLFTTWQVIWIITSHAPGQFSSCENATFSMIIKKKKEKKKGLTVNSVQKQKWQNIQMDRVCLSSFLCAKCRDINGCVCTMHRQYARQLNAVH